VDTPDLKACSAFAEKPDQALDEVLAAKKSWLEAARANGKPIPYLCGEIYTFTPARNRRKPRRIEAMTFLYFIALMIVSLMERNIRKNMTKAGLTPATQIEVSGCSGMALAHSRGTSCAAPRCVPRITSCDSFSTQCRLPVGRHGYEPSPNILNVFPTISCFL